MRQYSLLAALLLLFNITLIVAQDKTTVYAYDAEKYSLDVPVDVISMKAELKVMPYQGKLAGTVNYSFIPLRNNIDTFSFNIQDISIRSVILDGKSIKFQPVGDRLIMRFDKLDKSKLHSISLDYEAKPQNNLYFVGWNDPKQLKRKQVWGNGPYHWIPFLPTGHHDVLTTELLITVDSKFKVFSNGDRISIEDNNDGTSVWHYKLEKPTPYLCIALAIGEYEYQQSVSNTGIKLEHWYYSGLEDNIATTYKYSEYMFEFLEGEFGVKYPWSQYRQVPLIDYLWGAVEGTSSTIFADFYLQDERAFLDKSYVNTNCHELVHQWFGNYVAHVGAGLNSPHRWLTESFATYYAKIFMKDIYGDDYYQMEKVIDREYVMKISEKNSYPVSHMYASGYRTYRKGSWVLDMLRYVIEDDAFKTGVNQYLTDHAHEGTETHDLYQAFRKSTGLSLGWFFEQWIMHGGEPVYEVSYESLMDEVSGVATYVKVQQIHELNDYVTLFKMPIVFQVHYTDGSFDQKKEIIEKEHHTVVIPNTENKNIAYVLFDPGNKILKHVIFERTITELEAQLLNAPQMIDRYDALLGLKEVAIIEKRELLYKSFNKDEYELMRKEVVAQLADDLELKSTEEIFIMAINDKASRVRKEVLNNITTISSELKPEVVKMLIDSSYVNIELALRKLCEIFPEETDSFLGITKDEIGWKGRNVKIAWLELAVTSGKYGFLKDLIDYSSMSYDFETRMNAIKALQRMNYCNHIVLGNVFHAYLYWNPKLYRVGKEALEYFMQNDEYKPMIKKFVENKQWTEKELERIKQIVE